jgi:ABC-type multidrug transport system ATPase subunit/pSer/pThr/pTyr-binding forkhead associated (FHA) protein
VFGILTFEGQDSVEERHLTQPITSLGRAPENDVLLDHPLVSRFHARILSDGNGTRIVDLGSGNGTRVDGAELEVKVERGLVGGSLIEIGPFTIRFSEAVPGRGALPGADRLPAEPIVQTVLMAALPPARLIVTTPQGVSEVLLTAQAMTLGRDPASDIVVDSEAVSRRHACLERRDGHWEITDLGSTNGLRFQGKPVQSTSLANGDVVYIGRSVALEFRHLEAAWAAGVQPRPSEEAFDLPSKGTLVLGRSKNADVTLFHPSVQREHAQIVRRGSDVYLQDLGSSAGTYVNGQLVTEHLLAEGDVVRIGPSRLVLEHGRLRVASEEGRLRIDAFHLSRVVGKGLRILQDVSLSILPQEFIAIVGGSGAGKSTLLTALCGYRPADAGAVLLNGTDLYRNFNAYRNDLGYVPQDDIIHRELPVRRSLDYAAQLRMPADTSIYERQQRIEEVMEELDIRLAADRPVRQLSGGQRKRVSIGVELLTRPSLFFLDEATSGLDPGTETQMMKLLRRLADQGRTVALVTHATKNVMICDKVIFMARGGRMAYYGPPEEALRYFEVDDFDEIYNRLDQGDSAEWEGRFRQSRPFQENVVSRLSEVQAMAAFPGGAPGTGGVPGGYPGAAAAPAAWGPGVAQPGALPSAPRQMSSFRQFVVLCKRYLDTVWCDKKTAVLLFALAPVLGMLNFVEWNRDLFSLETGSATKAVTMFFMNSIVCILLGIIASVREIVKENAVYRRERMVGLRVMPYLGSKVAIAFGLAFYSALVLWAFNLAAVDFSHLSLVSKLELLVPMVLCTFAGAMWGLLVSALAPSEDRAMLFVILVFVPQFVFSGGMIPTSDLGVVGKVIGWVMSIPWALGAMVTSAQIESGPGVAGDLSDTYLPGIQGLSTTAEKQSLIDSLHDQYGDIFHVDLAFYWGMALVVSLALIAVVIFLQKRKDTL